MKNIKGSVVKPFIMTVRANKTGVYDKLISEKGKIFLSKRILDSVWYPFDDFKEIHDAVCQIEARNNPKILFQMGLKSGETIMKTIYLGAAVKDIKGAVDKYARFHKLIFSWGKTEAVFTDKNTVILSYKDFEQDWKNFYYLASGWAHKYLELCVNQKVSQVFLEKSWEGAEATSFQFTW